MPSVQTAETEGVISSWWFIRKGPCWRVRCCPGSAASTAELEATIGRFLDSLLSRSHVLKWRHTVYEPETWVFGGDDGTAIAYHLFHADSSGILDHLARSGHTGPPGHTPIGRRELTVLLCSTLMRAARLDWYEQADVWHRVHQMRPLDF
ncbi:MAG: thiopeptide-type bacteriocin biosynthesis protein, partial [Nocardioidaceae bacterium]